MDSRKKIKSSKIQTSKSSMDFLKNEGTWCILLTAGILPFVVHLYEYSMKAADYSWFPLASDISTDLFSHCKTVFLYIVGTILLLSIIYNVLTKKIQKPSKAWYVAGLLGIFYILSGIFSVSKSDSFSGNFNRFETVFILLIYLLITFSASQIREERAVKLILFIIMAAQIPMIIIGYLQIAGINPFNSNIIQSLILPASYRDGSELIITNNSGGKVFLTFSNSNYASVYIAMVIILLTIWFFIGKIWQKIMAGIIEVALFIILIYTQSRTGIIMLAVAGLIALIITAIINRKIFGYICIGLCVLIGMAVGIDAINDFSLASRVKATFDSFSESYVDERLEYIITEKDHVDVKFNEYEFSLSCNPINYPQGIPELEDLVFFETEIDDEEFLCMNIKNSNDFWLFTYSDESYLIYTGNDKYDTVTPIDHIDLDGLYHMASGRVYIWSRAIPLLKKYWLLGSGPDTFFRVFPQNDYVGKSKYCSSNLTIVEKPHNMYLMTAIQNGIPALILFLAFVCIYIVKTLKTIKHNVKNTRIININYSKPTNATDTKKTGINDINLFTRNVYPIIILLTVVAYLVSGFFNDSNVCTSPLFYIVLGLGIGMYENNN